MANLNTDGIYQFQIKATLEGGSTYIQPNITKIEVEYEPKSLSDVINYAPMAEKSFDMWTYIINETDSLVYTSPKIEDLENNTISIEPLNKNSFYDFKHDEGKEYFQLSLKEDQLVPATYELKFKLTDDKSSLSSTFRLLIRIIEPKNEK